MEPLFQPLSVRRGVRKPFVLQEGVPLHIREQVVPTVQTWLYRNPEHAARISVALEIPVDRSMPGWPAAIASVEETDDDTLLDVVDMYLRLATLHLSSVSMPTDGSKLVRDAFKLGHSVWAVKSSGWDPWFLERRVSDEMSESYRSALTLGNSAASHLSDAWRFVFSRQADSSSAWSSSTKALEAALAPIVLPKNDRAQYGTIVKALRDKPGKWDSDMSGGDAEERVAAFIQLLELVPYAPDRHGTPDFNHIEPSLARSIVLITTSILELINQKGLRRIEA